MSRRGRRGRHHYGQHGHSGGPPPNSLIAHPLNQGQPPDQRVYEPERILPGNRMPVIIPFAAERFGSQMPQHRRRTIAGELESVQRVALAVGQAANALLNVYDEVRRAGWLK